MSTTQTAPTAVTYMLEPAHSRALFKVRHMMIANVRGEFSKVSGTVTLDPANPTTASISVEIAVDSINTHEPDRDNHLKSADFLDAANHPIIWFKSNRVEAEGGSAYKVTGDLTIRGVTKEVVLDVEDVTPEVKDPWGYLRRGAEATARINRKDFGLTWNQALETGGLLVGETVDITLAVELARQA
jgi:polyisoprenoid-binding protein YceI